MIARLPVLLTLLAASLDGDQSAQFEAASVKPAAPQPAGYANFARVSGGPGTTDPGELRWANVPLGFVLRSAYGRKEYEVIAPKWLESERFDVVAKVPAGATKKDLMAMLQSLLTERFQLSIHHEQKELAAFTLSVGKNGPKIRETSSVTPFPPDGFPKVPEGRTEGHFFGMMTADGSMPVTYKNQTLADLADHLTTFVQRPVADRTGLKAKYDFTLRFTPETIRPAGVSGAPAMDVPDEQRVTLFQAIQSQLGLKLEPGKAAVDILVVDRVEKRPTEN